MKQFNLEEYLANPSRKLVTRDGRSVRIVCTDAKGDYPVVALIEKRVNREFEEAQTFTKNGIWNTSLKEHQSDIFFAPEKREGWTNVYEEGTNRYLDGCICATKEEAKKIRGCGYITTIRIEWEE